MRATWILRAACTVLWCACSAALHAQDDSLSFPKPLQITVQEKDSPKIDYRWELRPRPPVPFTPFEMVDPNTGRPVRPDDIVMIGGARMRAADYYRQLNEMEQWLNKHGYSMRTDSEFPYYSQLLEGEIAESEKRLRELESQFPLSGEPVSQDDSDFMPAACRESYRQFATDWLGNSNFGLRIHGQAGYEYCVLLPAAYVLVRGNAVLEGRLGGTINQIADAQAAGMVSVDDIRSSDLDYSYGIRVRVLGNTVWAPSGQGTVPLRYERTWDWQIAQVNWRSGNLQLGCWAIFGIPICIYGNLGLSGSLHLSAGIDLSVGLQRAYTKPYGNLNGYAEVWLGLDIGFANAGAGIRGNVEFIRGGVRAEAKGGISSYGSNPTCYEYGFGGYLNAEIDRALSGNLEAFARACVRFMRQWRCAEGRWNLFSWNGFSWPDVEIGRWAISVPLGCL